MQAPVVRLQHGTTDRNDHVLLLDIGFDLAVQRTDHFIQRIAVFTLNDNRKLITADSEDRAV